MSLYDYKLAQKLDGTPFYALLMAAIRQADSVNLAKFEQLFPDTVREVRRRFDSVGGRLPEDPPESL